MNPARGVLLVDASVLIDYCGADLAILALVSRHVARVHVATVVLSEVDDLDESDCAGQGILVVEPTLAQAQEAAAASGKLSFADRTCLIVCRDHGWTCVTNDRRLRDSCKEAGVEARWGLELMLDLVRLGQLPRDNAKRAARRIHELNPVFVPLSVVEAFNAKLDAL